jgi:hypothetical protein
MVDNTLVLETWVDNVRYYYHIALLAFLSSAQSFPVPSPVFSS